MRGRKPKPTAIKQRAGNPGKRKLSANEPVFSDDAPAPPEWMEGEARAEWDRVVPELLAAGVMAKAFRAAIVAYCESWALFVKAKGMVSLHGETTITDKGNEIQSPWLGIQNRAHAAMLKAAVEFGLTPSSKGRLNVDRSEPSLNLSHYHSQA